MPVSDAPLRPWQGRRVVLGVTGGIAAYKTVTLARRLTRLGAEVDVVLTRGAREFVTPLSFEGVTGRPVQTELFSVEGAARHIRLGTEAEVVCVAPATADFLARAAGGRADDLLATTLLVTRAPVLLCPAMNDRMWGHAQVRANARHCREVLGYRVLGPAEGPLAVGEADGPGRMVEPEEIVEHVGRLLGGSGPLAGRRVLLTSGPTREALDPVRYLGNRSSGRMGFALAAAAWRRGAEVTVVSGPTELPAPTGVEVIPVETAGEMDAAVRERVGSADVVVYAAAVGDFRPADPLPGKRKRGRDGEAWSVALTANPDIAAGTRSLRRPGAVAVGFALETEDLLANAAAKRAAKGFDLVVANPAGVEGAGFGAATNRVTILGEGEPEALPLLSKEEVADAVLDRVEALVDAR
ncbi:MAG: bifunctional phosphopantothenoylcysteine decarboxylase/phosphopantothenate--cysteine ligase CoaBC [Longimicrobiales bacterium]|nr:bifunctional phosphopantothenoylcysteine decarboxylase/phosphopantothenate--cysteine ligase CoaBC [Longimicrobiales bacterium]